MCLYNLLIADLGPGRTDFDSPGLLWSSLESRGPLQLDGGQGDVGGGLCHHGAAAGLQGDRHKLLLSAPGGGGADVDPLLSCLRVDRCLKLFVFQSLDKLSRLLLVEDNRTLNWGDAA